MSKDCSGHVKLLQSLLLGQLAQSRDAFSSRIFSNTSRFAVGDRVYGRMPLAKIGAFAEYAAVAEGALAHVPDHLSDEKAACVPLTALTALQSLGLMGAKAGDSIFISGGTGSLGAMAVPIAVSMGLVVGGRDRCGQIACKEHRNWNSPACEKKMFPQVNRNTPHIEKQYSPYRKTILPISAGRAENPTGTHSITMERQNRRSGAILPMSGKILPISEFQLELTRLSSK